MNIVIFITTVVIFSMVSFISLIIINKCRCRSKKNIRMERSPSPINNL